MASQPNPKYCPAPPPVQTTPESFYPCVCRPTTFILVLNLGLSCPQTQLDYQGVESVSCYVEGPIGTTNLQPVSIQSIEFTEIDSGLHPLASDTEVLAAPYSSGDIVEYVSNLNEQSYGLSVNMVGRNREGEVIENRATVFFDQSQCDIAPSNTYQ